MKNLIKFCILGIFFTQCGVQEWAVPYFVRFSDVERSKMADRSAVVIKKELSLPATQILFSWNALRPKNGKYVFFMQIYDATTKRWSDWVRVAEWGKHNQRSFEKSLRNQPSFFYVRWQIPDAHISTKCRVKVEVMGGASLRDLYQLSFAAINFSTFVSENGARFSFPSIGIKNMPPISQMEADHSQRNSICSPASLSMVVSYLNGRYEAPETFAEGAYDNGLQAYGSWPFNVAHAFDRCKKRFYFAVTRLNSFAEIYKYLIRRLPVVVSVRGGMNTMPEGKTYKEGHLLVVAGWDNDRKKVLCYDPAFDSYKKVSHAYDILDFIKAWERSKRLAYVIEPRL